MPEPGRRRHLELLAACVVTIFVAQLLIKHDSMLIAALKERDEREWLSVPETRGPLLDPILVDLDDPDLTVICGHFEAERVTLLLDTSPTGDDLVKGMRQLRELAERLGLKITLTMREERLKLNDLKNSLGYVLYSKVRKRLEKHALFVNSLVVNQIERTEVLQRPVPETFQWKLDEKQQGLVPDCSWISLLALDLIAGNGVRSVNDFFQHKNRWIATWKRPRGDLQSLTSLHSDVLLNYVQKTCIFPRPLLLRMARGPKDDDPVLQEGRKLLEIVVKEAVMDCVILVPC